MTRAAASEGGPSTKSEFWADNLEVLQSHARVVDYPVPLFGVTDKWDLRSLGWSRSAGANSMVVSFTALDGAWNLAAREIAMALLNPAHEKLRDNGLFRKLKPSHPLTVNNRMTALRKLVRWLAVEHPEVRYPADLQQHHLDAFLVDVRSQFGPSTLRSVIITLRELHHHAPVLSGGGLDYRPWGDADAGKLAGETFSGELSTPVIPPAVWWPLLRASWRYIDVFSHDIAAAESALDSVSQKSPSTQLKYADDRKPSPAAQRQALDTRIRIWLNSPDSYVPVHREKHSRHHRRAGTVNWKLLSLIISDGRTPAVFGLSVAQRRQWVQDAIETGRTKTRPGGLDVATAIVQRADGSEGAWIDGWDGETIYRQRIILRDACLVFCFALTMMRSSELMSITKGSLTTHYGAPAVRAKLRKLRGRAEEHNWWIIEPVAEAIRVVERLSHTEHVFGAARGRHYEGDRFDGLDAGRQMKAFLLAVNEMAETAGLEPIPDFNISPHMFRRTMSVIAAQQPDGEIALGLQLKHAARRALANATTHGYAAATTEWAAEFEHELQEETAGRLVSLWAAGRDAEIRLAGAGSQKFREGLKAVDGQQQESEHVTPPKIGDEALLRSLLRDEFSTLRWGTVNHCLGIVEQAECLKGVPEDVATQGVMPNRCDPAGCRNSVVTSDHLPVWIAEADDLTKKLKDKRMASHHREQLEGELAEVLGIVEELSDD